GGERLPEQRDQRGQQDRGRAQQGHRGPQQDGERAQCRPRRRQHARAEARRSQAGRNQGGMSEQTESFISHLIELRQRLVHAVGATLVVFVALFIWPGSGYIYDLLAMPLIKVMGPDAKMIATGVITPFMVPVKVTALVAFMIALPYVLYQAWAFVAPGLYENEK